MSRPRHQAVLTIAPLVPIVSLLAGCRLEIGSASSDARAVGRRAERSAERRARQAGLPAADLRVLLGAVAEVSADGVGDLATDRSASRDLEWSGLQDADRDGVDDDEAIELVVDDIVVCVFFADQRGDTADGPC